MLHPGFQLRPSAQSLLMLIRQRLLRPLVL
jgi:hypothetical protein